MMLFHAGSQHSLNNINVWLSIGRLEYSLWIESTWTGTFPVINDSWRIQSRQVLGSLTNFLLACMCLVKDSTIYHNRGLYGRCFCQDVSFNMYFQSFWGQRTYRAFSLKETFYSVFLLLFSKKRLISSLPDANCAISRSCHYHIS